MSYFFGRREQNRSARGGALRRVSAVTFCDMRRCSRLAEWSIAYGTQSVCFCQKHTLATMKDAALWNPS